jgi:hypothetical protein
MKIAVHKFESYDITRDVMVTSTRYGTVVAIKETARGVVIPGSEILIEASDLSTDIEGFTVKGYTPKKV